MLNQQILNETYTALEQDQAKVKDNDDQDLKKKISTPFKNITTDLLEHARDEYGKALTLAISKNLANKLNGMNDKLIIKHFSYYDIANRKSDLEKQKEINAAKADGNLIIIPTIEARYEQEVAKHRKTLVENIRREAKNIVEESAKLIIKEVETHDKKTEKNNLENDMRDHLRGFARTIPLLLMAYGTEDTALENIDKTIPEHVFKDVTGITLEEFRKLRDGFDVIDSNGNSKHYLGCFDAVAFNNAVKEFFKRKTN